MFCCVIGTASLSGLFFGVRCDCCRREPRVVQCRVIVPALGRFWSYVV
jgi:hypothetical protein